MSKPLSEPHDRGFGPFRNSMAVRNATMILMQAVEYEEKEGHNMMRD